ncbi:MAG: 4-hydroxythreonine-4-phosphate dehydrogenase PdxA [Planctomycetia bacterium]|nr:4-hydroxythreonine-4-phosphate dehydrogenase PdxA [Planctomycetia bacterium]
MAESVSQPQLHERPVLALTMGDPAGVGPEIIVDAWRFFFQLDQPLASGAAPLPASRPIVFGDPETIRRAVDIYGYDAQVVALESLEQALDAYDRLGNANTIPVLPCCARSVSRVQIGEISAEGGDAAFRSLNCAIDATLSGRVQAIVTLPLHKESLNLAGHHYPGHTEILAERCNVRNFSMALYLGACSGLASSTGLGVAHVTLHMAMSQALSCVTYQSVLEKIRLLRRFMTIILSREPRLGVCALNCHAGDGGLFGREELDVIRPATLAAQAEGADVAGPFPSDTLFLDAKNGLYDGIVAMYHDQGHIAIKMIDMFAAVNVALGLPIIRTSVAHGTAFNIAGQGVAKTTSLIEAVRVATLFALNRQTP